MRAQITLTPSESKRLIAKGVKALPSIQKALLHHRIILAGGTTNGFLAEELLGEAIEKKSTYTVGIITNGKTGVSAAEDRIHPFVITKGKAEGRDFHWKSYLPQIEPGDVFIKGGNAVDHTGLAAVLASDSMGGTIGAAWGPLMQRGIELVVPIGLEKLVPDVREAVEFMAGHPIDLVIGDKVGLMPLLGATVITEITALETLYQVKAKCIASGGVDGSEGAVVLVIDGEENEVKKAFDGILSLKGEPQVR
ncbi:MAG: hypothetical protein GX434_09185 [Peptococcaceae bacterium]|nr:hypothetical protein [Peptococcaceae bacterium]